MTTQGLQRVSINASAVGTTPGSSLSTGRWFQTMSWDDNSTAFAASDLDLDRGGTLTISNELDQLLDSSPSRSSQTVSHVATIAAGTFNGVTIRRIGLHDDTATNVSSSSDTLAAGVDGQTIAKTSTFALTTTLKITYA